MEEQDIINRFRRLHITTSSKEDFKSSANSLLDQLISVAHQTKDDKCEGSPHFIPDQELCSFVSYGCKVLDDKNQLLRSKFADALTLILINGKRTLPKEALPVLLTSLLSCINQSASSLKINFLQALGASLYGNGANIDLEQLDLLIGTTSSFWSYLDPNNNNYALQIKAVECIGNLCHRNSAGMCVDKSFIRLFYQKVVDFLRMLLRLEESDDLDLYKLIAKSLKVLQSIIAPVTFQDQIIEPEFAIALLRVYIIYGLPGFRSTVTHLIRNLPSARTTPEFETEVIAKKTNSPIAKQVVKKKRKGKKASNKNKSKPEDEQDYSEASQSDSHHPMFDDNILRVDTNACFVSSQSSSESEFSDPETGFRSRLRTTCCRIRQNACKCIQDILKTSDRRTKLSSWLLLVPESASQIEPCLMKCFKHDPSSKVRLSALATLMELLNDSKQYLEAAVDRSQNQPSISRSFVPFSVKLNQSLIALHEAFLDHLGDRRSTFATDKSLQCLSILILNTPYEKIGTKNLYKIFQIIPKYLHKSDTNVIISSLTCIAATLSARPNDPELLSLLMMRPKTMQNHHGPFPDSANVFKSWLVRYCFLELDLDDAESFSDLTNQNRIQNQCLQLLKIIVQFFPSFVTSPERKVLVDLISAKYVKMSDCMLSLHSIKLLEEFGKSFSKMELENERRKGEELDFWKGVLDGPLIKLFQSQNPVFKMLAAACDVLSTLSANCFENLHIRYQIMVKTLLLGAADDVDVPVKSAGVRALGVLVTYPFVKEDDSFLVDVGQMIFKQLKSLSLNVRIKAGWSLGNFTDSLLKNEIHDDTEGQSGFSDNFILELLSACKNAALDHDKIKPNGVRAIGNVLKWFPSPYSEKPDMAALIEEVIEALIQSISSGPMKARWNACYACGNMFQARSLPLGKAKWTNSLLDALGKAMKDCKNFKVRISAASALSSPKNRLNYGDIGLFGRTWENAVDALVSSENLSDFTEFKFKNNLQNKVCHLLCHLLSIAMPDDLAVIHPSISKHSDLLNNQIARFLDEMTKQKIDFPDQPTTSETLQKDINIECLIGNISNFGSLRMIQTKLATI